MRTTSLLQFFLVFIFSFCHCFSSKGSDSDGKRNLIRAQIETITEEINTILKKVGLINLKIDQIEEKLKWLRSETDACLKLSQKCQERYDSCAREYSTIESNINTILRAMDAGLRQASSLSNEEHRKSLEILNDLNILKARWLELQTELKTHLSETHSWAIKSKDMADQIPEQEEDFEVHKLARQMCQDALKAKEARKSELESEFQSLMPPIVKIYLQPRVCGKEVVLQAVEVVRMISLEANLVDISVFLVRIAQVESRMGHDPNTYRGDYCGGIWQVDKKGFDDSKKVESHPGLKNVIPVADKYLSQECGEAVSWSTTSWDKCVMPLFSCVAARLFLAVVPGAVPETLEDQAKYWKDYYNGPGKGTEERFIKEAI